MAVELVPRQPRVLILHLIVEGEPVPKQRVRTGKGRFYTPAKTLHHEELIEWSARDRVSEPTRNPVILEMDFFMGNARKVDGDNLQKTVMDALNGVAWRDDSQVIEWTGHKHVDREMPRTELRVWEVAV